MSPSTEPITESRGQECSDWLRPGPRAHQMCRCSSQPRSNWWNGDDGRGLIKKEGSIGNFLAVRWLGLQDSPAGCTSSMCGRRTKIPHAMVEQPKKKNRRGLLPGMEKAMAPHSSTLAWKIPWTEGPGRLQSMGSLRVGHD